MRAITALVVAATMTVGIAAPPADAAPGDHAHLEAEFVARINDLRATQGLHPLAVHPNLVEKARSWSATMAAEGRIWHSDLTSGITVDWQRIGENVGVGPSVASLHEAFMASPGHYKNLVATDFTHVGIGITVDDVGTIYVAEEFMVLKPAAATTTTTAPEIIADHAGLIGGSPEAPLGSSEPESVPTVSGSADEAPSTEADGADRVIAVLERLRSLDG